MMNDTQKEMRQGSEELAKRQVLVAKAIADGHAEKRKIDEEAKAKKEAVDAKIRAIGNGETVDVHKETGSVVHREVPKHA